MFRNYWINNFRFVKLKKKNHIWSIQANLLTNAPFDNFNTSLFFWFGYDVQITLKLRQINYLSHPMRKLKYVILPNNNNDGCNREGVDTSERRLGVFQYLKMDGFNRKYIIDWKCTSRVCKVEIFLKWRGGGFETNRKQWFRIIIHQHSIEIAYTVIYTAQSLCI